MKTISIDLPETVFSALRKEPDEFAKEMRIAAALKWYEIGEISQGQAAEIAGLSRSEFINMLSQNLASAQAAHSYPSTKQPQSGFGPGYSGCAYLVTYFQAGNGSRA